MSTSITLIHPIKHPSRIGTPVEFADGISITDGTLGAAPGSMNWDPSQSVMNIRNEYADSILQVGQELYVHVCNNTGSTLNDGEVVQLNGYDGPNDCFTVSLAKADSLDTASVLGIVTTTMLTTEKGLVTIFGRINEIDTTGETSGAPVYLSDTNAGEWTTVKPPIPIRLGFIGCIATDGCILVNIDQRPPSIYASLYSAVTQTYNGTDSAVVELEEEYGVVGVGHSKTVNPEEMEIFSSGTYVITGNFEVYRTSGANAEEYRAWLQRYPNGGSAWENVVATNIKTAVYNGGETARLSANVGAYFEKGDKLRVMARASDSTIEIQAVAAAGDEPAQASVMFSLYRLGD